MRDVAHTQACASYRELTFIFSPMMIRPILAFCLTALILTLSACVSIDSQALKVQPAPGAQGNIQGTFWNRALHSGDGEFPAADTFARALNIPAIDAPFVHIITTETGDLVIQFIKHKAVIFERSLQKEKEFVVDHDGAIVLKQDLGHSHVDDGPGFGVGWGNLKLFLDKEDNLNVIQSGGGAGVVGIFPIALYVKHISIFRRIPDSADLDPP